MLGVIFETLNFALTNTIAISLVTEFSALSSEEYFVNMYDLSTTRRWITIEGMRIIVTVLANIIVISIRSTLKDPIRLDLDHLFNSGAGLSSLDYLRSETTQNQVNYVAISLFPVIVQSLIRY